MVSSRLLRTALFFLAGAALDSLVKAGFMRILAPEFWLLTSYFLLPLWGPK